MDSLTSITLFLMSAYLIVLPIVRLSQIRMWSSLSRKMRTELKASMGRMEPGQILTLCDGYPDNPVSRIAKGFLSRIESLRGPASLRVRLFKLLCNDAAAREEARLRRGVAALRTIAVVSGPIGAITSAWDLAAIGLSWMSDTEPAFDRTSLSELLSYAIAGGFISMAGLIAYKCLSSKVEAESANLRDLSSMLAVNFSARS